MTPKKTKKPNKKKNSRKVSIKNKKITQKDIEKIETHIESIRSKKTNDIKKRIRI